MHVIIAGGGKGGRRLIDLFRSHPNHKVTVIESDPRVCESISETCPNVDIVLGNAAHPKTLKEAMNKESLTFIAVTGDDHMNLLAAKAAQKLGVPNILLRIVEPEYRELSEVFELNNVLDPTVSMSAQIVTRLNGVDFSQLIHSIYPDLELKELSIEEYPGAAGAPMSTFASRVAQDAYPILIRRDGDYIFPTSIETLSKGDRVICWVRNKKRLIDRLTGGGRL
ncbi:MAG: NAD-binding protein [Bacillota bacterium]